MSKINRRDHVAWMRPKSDSNPLPHQQKPPADDVQSPKNRPAAPIDEEQLSWIDEMTTHGIPAVKPPPLLRYEIEQNVSPPPPRPVILPSDTPQPSPSTSSARKLPVWTNHYPPSVDIELSDSELDLLSPKSIIVSSAPSSVFQNVPNLPSEMKWLIDYAMTRDSIKLNEA